MSDLGGIDIRLRQAGPIQLDVDLACGLGQVLALVGPSGSGKSTILRSVAGLYQPAEARVSCNGRVWVDSGRGVRLPVRQRPVGMVFQSYALFPHLSALANLMAAMDHLPAGQRAQRARDLLSLVNLPGLEDRRPHQLSGGQQQRVAVARALARDPKVLLLDEPFSAVDRATRERLYVELAELRGKLGIPILLVTHDLDEASQLADQVCIIHHGRTLQTGPPSEVRTKPLNLTVARLVHIKNVFTAKVAGHTMEDGQTVLDWRGSELKVSLHEQFSVGDEAAWCVSTTSILLVEGSPPGQPVEDNQLRVTLAGLVFVGDMVRLTLTVPGGEDECLFAAVPLHQVQRLGLRPRQEVTVSLPCGSIHLMPAPAKK